jgi:hypothetical protein
MVKKTMLNYKSMLGVSHYESYTFSHYYIISHVSINQSKKRVVSSLNVFTKKIDHKVESLADAA